MAGFRALGLSRDRRGGAAITLAISLAGIAGLAGLGTEAAGWYVTKRTMQGAADSAAYTAALALNNGASSTAVASQAKSIAASYGFADGSNSVTVTVNTPPLSGNYTNNDSAVEVIVSQPQPLQLAGLFLAAPPTIQVRSVAAAVGSGGGCVLALDRGSVTDVSETGTTVVNLNNCSLYVNSTSSDALNMTGKAQINAWSAYISGGYQTSGQAALSTTHGTNLHAPQINDPYADVPVPAPSSPNLGTIDGTQPSYSPGTYRGISVSGGKTANLLPGVYVLDGGSLNLSGGATLNGSGVTIVLTSSSGSYGTVSVSGGTTLNLTAPTTGATAGIAIFQDRAAPSSGSDSFSGGTTQNITGAIYIPNQPVTFSGGTSTGGAACTQLVALTVTFNGNATFNTDCSGVGTRSIGTSPIRLVE